MKKDDLVVSLEDEHERFLDTIEGLSDEALEQPGVVGDWSVKDIIAHLSAWEAELIKLLWQVRQGQRPTSIHFSKTPVDEINARWKQETEGRSFERVIADFHSVRKQTIRRVNAFSDKELNDAQRYSWLDGHPLWEWIANDSFQHEAEHNAQIREWGARSGI